MTAVKEKRPIAVRKKAILIAKAAKFKKAENILVLNLKDISTFCDYFVICEASSITRMGAISKNIKETLEGKNIKIWHTEGTPESKWVLLDCGDVVVHIFDKETRNFYRLERLWGDAPLVKIEEKRKNLSRKRKKDEKKK